ncbi:MAG TPA: DUF4087 domain-containing protein [Limnobacter sp.]|nr:DUF4087 domain-containing protein [Limnobacter sp.]
MKRFFSGSVLHGHFIGYSGFGAMPSHRDSSGHPKHMAAWSQMIWGDPRDCTKAPTPKPVKTSQRCACVHVAVDPASKHVLTIQSAKAPSLQQCRKDPAIKAKESKTGN